MFHLPSVRNHWVPLLLAKSGVVAQGGDRDQKQYKMRNVNDFEPFGSNCWLDVRMCIVFALVVWVCLFGRPVFRNSARQSNPSVKQIHFKHDAEVAGPVLLYFLVHGLGGPFLSEVGPIKTTRILLNNNRT